MIYCIGLIDGGCQSYFLGIPAVEGWTYFYQDIQTMNNINMMLVMLLVISPTLIHSRTVRRLSYAAPVPVGVAQNYEDDKVPVVEGLDEEY